MAGQREQYRGSMLQAIDGKGRVAIPASLRGAMEVNFTEKLILLTPHSKSKCLTAYDKGWSNELTARVNRAEERALDLEQEFDMDAVAIDSVGAIDELPYDASGRFILPNFARNKARLEDFALFVGAINTFQIWNPQLFLAAPNVADHVKERVEYMLAERGAA